MRHQKMIHQVMGSIVENDGGGVDIIYHHERHRVGDCPWCDFIRVERVADEFIRRVDECGRPIPTLNMWSLGSSLKDTRTNRNVMLKRWYKFRWRMNHLKAWCPLFRVLEVGRRGYLHFHVIVGEFIAHAVVMKEWRDLTQERSNVHVSPGGDYEHDPRRLTRYLMKYLQKESSTYRWMGPLYGLGDTSRAVREVGGRELVFAGDTPYAMITDGYREKEGSPTHISSLDEF